MTIFTPRFPLGLLAALICILPVRGAVTGFPAGPIDWLELDTNGIDLLGDQSTSLATLRLDIQSGLPVPGTPSPGLLNEGFWLTEPPVLDSLTGTSTIPTFEIRLIPVNGAPDYEVEIILPHETDIVLVIGQLFSDPNDATNQVGLSATSSLGPAEPELLGSFGWDNGLIPFNEPLEWDAVTNRLDPAPGANGESQIALFRINGTNRTTITVPSGYAQNTGDSVTFAVAIIPEPESLLLLLGAAALFCHRRHR